MMTKPVIDWEPLHQYGKQEIECRCGKVFRSYAKGVSHDGSFRLFTETPCPSCGSDNDVRRASSGPESWTIG